MMNRGSTENSIGVLHVDVFRDENFQNLIISSENPFSTWHKQKRYFCQFSTEMEHTLSCKRVYVKMDIKEQ